MHLLNGSLDPMAALVVTFVAAIVIVWWNEKRSR